MNIESAEVIHQCSLRCSYQYNYGTSACVVTNHRDYLEFAYDDGVSSVFFNEEPYVVKNVRLYRTGIHAINRISPAAELVIHLHARDSMTKNLQICIPFSQKDERSNANDMWSQIMPHLPDVNQTQSINVPAFSLNAFTPKGAYFYYNGTNVADVNDNNYDVIVFEVWPNISVSNRTLLYSKLQEFQVQVLGTDRIYYNRLGTTAGNIDGSDDIYIDCQPTDDGPDILPAKDEPISTSILDEEKKERIWMIIFAIITFIVVFIVGVITFYLFRYLRPIVADFFNDSPRKPTM